MVSQSDLLPMMMPTRGVGSGMRLFHHEQRDGHKGPARRGRRRLRARSKIASMKVAPVLLVLALDSEAGAQAQPLDVKYSQFTLPNGLRVILHEDHSVPIVTVNTWYRAGSANEVPGRTGFAHLFEHLMFMGSGHVPYGEFDTRLESVGGGNNASTANDRTNYWISYAVFCLKKKKKN